MASKAKPASSKPSFASIVARAPPAKRVIPPSDKNVNGVAPKPTSAPTEQGKEAAKNPIPIEDDGLRSSMARLDVKEDSEPAGIEHARQDGVMTRTGLKFEDDRTHVSTSSTKETSVDGKSAISGVTFGLDEKESLRPDDSASVKAAEEDEFGSGPASGAPSSRLGSEAGVRAFRDQFQEISQSMRRGHAETLRLNENARSRGVSPSESHQLPAQSTPLVSHKSPVIRHLETNSEAPQFAYEYKGPDAKLLEALQSAKDRMFLLKLEDQVIDFVTHSHEPILDLPPCNSFCRLLAHKLADYYALTHFVDNAVCAVRLYRTPYCRIPTPLSTIVKTIVPDKTELSAQQNFKIMRRKQLGDSNQQTESGEFTTPSSADPSKATSEVGGDSQCGTGMASPAESNVTKDKASMTREEREAKYKETRERIFKGFESAESVESPITNEAPNGTSRTGSRAGKKKAWKNRNNDGSFEVRSQYSLGYNQQGKPAQFEHAPDPSAFYNSYQFQQQYQFDPNHSGHLTNAAYQQGYTQAIQTLMNEPGYAMGFQHAQMFSSMAANGHPMGQHMPASYGPGAPNAHFQSFYPQVAPTGQHSSAASSPALDHRVHASRPQSQPSNQPWLQPYPPYPYQQNHHQFQGTPFPNDQMQTGSTPYQSSPVNFPHGSADGRLQQAPPSSYHPQIFNPQTNPFVPGHMGSHFPPMQPQNQPNDSSQYQTGHFSDDHSNHLFDTMQNSNQQTHHFEPSAMAHAHADYMHDQRGNNSRRGGSGDVRSDANSIHSISKWNAPASLPPKPPPPETTNGLQTPSPRATLPYNTRHSGQHVPTFQNGVYSLPVATTR